MSNSSDGKSEIVIVRRKVADDLAGGKGGSWKIAYADFVTAMMAFFLVMWLINASNEKTRTQVANYFNPIKLTDTTTGARSLMDTSEVEDTKKKDTGKNSQQPTASQQEGADSTILSNPPQALDLIVKESAGGHDTGAKAGITEDLTPATSTKPSSPGIGDPFDPKSWERDNTPPPKAGDAEPIQNETANQNGKAAPRTTDGDGNVAAKGQTASNVEATPKVRNASSNEGQSGNYQAQATELLKQIATELGRANIDLKGSVDVKPTPDGLVISLTESEKFEMFRAGSAEPEPETIKLVAAIAKTITTVPGGLYVRGHTDSRPYRNKFYDNWQLSSARAHVARYMLVRGGFDDQRILRVEGVADRQPLNKENPMAAENRRIEFFIQMASP
jgi:chemotaxis protein MotB